MTEFWFNSINNLVSPANFNFKEGNKQVKMLNIVAMISIIGGLSAVFITKQPKYFGITVIVLFLTILFNSTVPDNKFGNIAKGNNNNSNNQIDDDLITSFDTGVKLTKSITPGNNQILLSANNNFKKGDIVGFNDLVSGNFETNVVSDVTITPNAEPLMILLRPLTKSYSQLTTKVLKVSDSMPNIVPGPDGYHSIALSELGSKVPRKTFDLPNFDRNDYNLELSTLVPGVPNSYQYQGQPDGPLKCKMSTPQNPMGNLTFDDYDTAPKDYGTCNIGENGNNQLMTQNQEAGVVQRVDDLLFHKGNSQWHFGPNAADVNPNDQTAFAHFLYRNPSNLVNPKYASVFVNDPEKFKLVSKLAQATGTENGGGGGGGGRGI